MDHAIHNNLHQNFGKHGDKVCTGLQSHTEATEAHLERAEIALSPKNRTELLSEATWREQRHIMQAAQPLAETDGLLKQLVSFVGGKAC
jgi:type I restriction enzyme M protein